MEQHTLLLAAEDLPLLSDLDLHSYSNILVMVFAKDKGLPVATARQLLAIQSHNAINIELNIPSAAMHNPEYVFAHLAGRIFGSSPETTITLFGSPELQSVIDICEATGQPALLIPVESELSFMAEQPPGLTDSVLPETILVHAEPPAVLNDAPEIDTPESPLTLVPKKRAELTEEEKKNKSIAELIAEREARIHKNEQLIKQALNKPVPLTQKR